MGNKKRKPGALGLAFVDIGLHSQRACHKEWICVGVPQFPFPCSPLIGWLCFLPCSLSRSIGRLHSHTHSCHWLVAHFICKQMGTPKVNMASQQIDCTIQSHTLILRNLGKERWSTKLELGSGNHNSYRLVFHPNYTFHNTYVQFNHIASPISV